MLKRSLLLVLAFLTLSGCAILNYTPPPPVQRSRDFQRPFDEVWSCTLEGLVKKGDTLASTDKSSGLIIIKNYGRALSSSDELGRTGARTPYGNYEWRDMRTEGTIFIKSVSPEVTRVTANFKILARGQQYQDLNNDNEPSNFKDYRKGNVHRVYARHPEEVVMETDGTLEQEYFVMIAGELLRARDAGI